MNADLQTIWRWVQDGFAWWLAELAALIPERWRKSQSRKAGLLAVMAENGTTQLWRDGKHFALKPGSHISSRVVVPPGAVLTREIELPVLARNDLKRLVANEIDRFTPFQAETVVFDTEVLERNRETGRQRVLLGILPRTSAVEILARARTAGVEPLGLAVQTSKEPDAVPRFDFLAALQDSPDEARSQRRLLLWWGGVAVLVALNLAIAIYRDTSRTEALQNAVDVQQSRVSVAMHLREKVTSESARRRDLLQQQALYAPLPILDAVSAALPTDAWVEHFEWNGKTARISGFSSKQENLLAAIEASPKLKNARALSSSAALTKNQAIPFEIVADPERKGP